MSDPDATPTNRLKCIEVKFQLLAAKGQMDASKGQRATDKIAELERKVTLLSARLNKYDPEYVARCLSR
jgi:hypothetical protein